MNPQTVIYHGNCLDGFTAAWAMKRSLVTGPTTQYVAANYGDAPPDVDGRDVWIVDFSYPRDVVLDIKRRAAHLVIFDHHKTAAEALDGLDFAVFDMNRSGAGITWDQMVSTKSRHWLVDYVEDRDLWRFKLDHSKEVNAWIGACRRDSFADWDALAETPLPQVIAKGEAVLAYIDRYVHEMSAQARTVRFEGHDVPMVNAPYLCISDLVGKLAESAPFAVGWFQRSDGKYAYSLRSRGAEGLDVSEIAMRFGGGGHRNAAGFSLPAQWSEQ